MSKLFNIRSKKIVPIIIVLLITIASAYAVLYINWRMTFKGEEPDVRFYSWVDGSRYNTISLHYNIYSNVWLRIKNISYGLENGASASKNITFSIQNISDVDKIEAIKIDVIDPNGTMVGCLSWRSGEPIDQARLNLVMSPKKIYTLELWIEGSPELRLNDFISVDLTIEVMT